MLSSSLDELLKLSKTSSPQKLFDYDCVTLYDLNLKYGESTVILFFSEQSLEEIKPNNKNTYSMYWKMLLKNNSFNMLVLGLFIQN